MAVNARQNKGRGVELKGSEMSCVKADSTGCRLAECQLPDCHLPECHLPVSRRGLIAAATVLGASVLGGAIAPATAEPADERPKEGDYLVTADGAHADGLSPNDISGPVIAWPMDPEARIIRKGSRLNKVLLVRLDPATLVGATRDRAAGGVVAYSAICPHGGCEVDGWIDEQQILECPCHNSKYNPREGAAIVEGPTTRGLAALPLKIVDDKLVVAKPFIGRLGIAPA
jgi:Rieske Fe-S protein